MNEIKLTIAIPTVYDLDRIASFEKLANEIYRQVGDRLDIIEFISCIDDRSISIGKKRQLLLDAANGEWFVMCDDDDFIAPTYIEDIMAALESNPDHVGFREKCNINGIESESTFSIQDKEWAELPNGNHIRCANPKSVVRTSIARQVGFPDMRYGEDRVYSEAVTALCKTEVFIDKHLYFYNHISTPHNERYGIK